MKKSQLLATVCIYLATVFQTVSATNIDLLTTPMTIGPTSLSFAFNGINASVSGYHVEYDASSTASDKTTIYGPFSTAAINTTNSDPIFGIYANAGLGLTSYENLGQTNDDLGAQWDPGFDNKSAGSPTSTTLPSFQFALFSFDTPVSLSQIVMKYHVSNSTDIWVAGGNSAPDLSNGFLGAFSGYSIVNSTGVLTSPFHTHTFPPLQNVNYLAIGVSPHDEIGDLGLVSSTGGRSDFYIRELNLTAVPVPAAIWLFGYGIFGLIGVARRKKAA